MSHYYGSINSSNNVYLNKKRAEEPLQVDNRYHHDRYDKYDKYASHSRYSTNNNYNQPKNSQNSSTNSYYSYARNGYRSGFYSSSKNYHNNGNGSNKNCACNGCYSSGNSNMRSDHNKKNSYAKFSGPKTTSGINEEVRNLSHCEILPLKPEKKKNEEKDNSLKSNSCSTEPESRNRLSSTSSNGNNISCGGGNKKEGGNNCGSSSSSGGSLNIKNLNKLVTNITSRIQPSNLGGHIFQNQQNINIKIHLTSQNLKLSSKEKDKDKDKDKQIFEQKKDAASTTNLNSIFKLNKPLPQLTFEKFNRNSIKIEENPLDKFEPFSKKLYEFDAELPQKSSSSSINDSINKDNIENALNIKSCYLLAKIQNWRLVTNFVPASSLTEEKFSKIIPLDENEYEKRNEQTNPPPSHKKRQTSIVYSGKYEETVEKSLDMNKSEKYKIKNDIFNIKSIIEQYHYDILKIKNKIKQNNYKTNYLSIKQESLNDAIEEIFKNE